MTINYIILAHKNPAQVARLIRKLSTNTTHFYIHVDQNSALSPFEEQLATSKNTHFVDPRQKGLWGHVGIVQATVQALKQIVADQRTGYCVLLSGQDYPIKSNEAIAQFFALHPGVSFADIFPLPTSNWAHGGIDRIEHYKFNLSEQRQDYIIIPSIFSLDFFKKWIEHGHNIRKLMRRHISPWVLRKKRIFPSSLQPYGGSQWWAIPVATAEKVLHFLERNTDYLPYHQYTLLPDEIALQSVLRHMCQEEDNTPIHPSVTYVNWDRPDVPLPVTFSASDLPELLRQPADKLFARKFDSEADARILDLLDQIG